MREYDAIAEWYASERRAQIGMPEVEALPAALAWGVIFHLTREDQARAIASVSRVLKTGAPFLFTAGDVDDEADHITPMNGVPFHYYSYNVEQYRRLLREFGLELVSIHKDTWENVHYLARKR